MAETTVTVKTTQLDGDVTIGRNVATGGGVTVQGDALFKKRVRVEGWLDARNIKGPCKGLFASEEALEEAFPSPLPGWWALVGDTLPADVYRVEDGAWKATGEQGGETNIELNQLEDDVSELQTDVQGLQENVSDLQSSLAEETQARQDADSTLQNSLAEETQARQDADESMQADITELQEAVWPITISLTATSTLLEYTGEAQTVTLTATTTRKGEQVTSADGTGLFYKGASLEERTENLGRGSQGYLQVNVSVNTLGTTTFGFAWYKDDVVKADATIGIRMVLPMYFGFSSLSSMTDTEMTALTKQTIKASAAGTYTLTASESGYAWFCVPSDMTISKVTLNGFDVPLNSYSTVSTSLGSYKCYRSSNALVAGTYTFVIS